MNVQVDRKLVRGNGGSRRYMMVTLTAPEAQASGEKPRPPANVAIVLDRSGSMQGDKLRLAKEAARGALGLLKRADTFSIVAYDHEIDVLVPASPVGPETLHAALQRLDALEARGQTALHEGWRQGVALVAQRLAEDAVGKCLLLTDGLANQGLTEPALIGQDCEQARARRVLTSTFGVGRDFDELLLDAMATRGGGNFYFVAEARQIPAFLQADLAETLEVVARDVQLEVRVPRGVKVAALHTYPTEETADGIVCRVSNLVSAQELRLLFQVRLPGGAVGENHFVTCALSDRDAALGSPVETVTWTCAPESEVSAQPRDRAVDRFVAQQYAAKARREALEANRAGRFAEARRLLEATARRIERYAGNDPELQALVQALRADATEHSVEMEMMRRKELHFRHYSSSKDRDMAMGSARRIAR
ncbi:MAG: VWA domain-containing protein [Vicinamibacteria bacterium]|nr:VWA domain-containing protein [Vicinamibacteria bacterium]